jgi:hypothetical protein
MPAMKRQLVEFFMSVLTAEEFTEFLEILDINNEEARYLKLREFVFEQHRFESISKLNLEPIWLVKQVIVTKLTKNEFQ